jgi:hypothetical protein
MLQQGDIDSIALQFTINSITSKDCAKFDVICFIAFAVTDFSRLLLLLMLNSRNEHPQELQ